MEKVEPLKSYCSICDAEGECEHQGAQRYLDAVVYTRTSEGWKVKGEAERHRFYNPPVIKSPAVAEIEPKPVQQLVVELEAWMPMDRDLEAEVRRCYEDNPRAVTLIAQNVLESVKAGNLRSPAGLLVSKLRKL